MKEESMTDALVREFLLGKLADEEAVPGQDDGAPDLRDAVHEAVQEPVQLGTGLYLLSHYGLFPHS